MADAASERIVVAAPPEACRDVVLDFERYPEWAHDVVSVVVEERDAEGRGLLVAFRASAYGRSASYTLRYDHADPQRLRWQLERGDLMRRLDGTYAFLPGPEEGTTEVAYELAVELAVPLPGFLKRRAEHKIMGTALRELKARVEGGPRR